LSVQDVQFDARLFQRVRILVAAGRKSVTVTIVDLSNVFRRLLPAAFGVAELVGRVRKR
jgi:hypothetical protein